MNLVKIFTACCFLYSPIPVWSQSSLLNKIINDIDAGWMAVEASQFSNYYDITTFQNRTLKGHRTQALLESDFNMYKKICGPLVKKGWAIDAEAKATLPTGRQWGCKKGKLRLVIFQRYSCKDSEGLDISGCSETKDQFKVFLGK
ncbi:MAG: hypothetical protein CL677_03390 [Bdellovibrionaceae bacterium]|nr:hypothetical protein [Pseudobdellovibrionaceae bacterium]|tara:strand:+ start:11058 stop:11492 length:435 start_codon:yes stop_codon:yes gene_type:complete